MNRTDDICEVTITGPDTEWLALFTKSLVADRLCASAHSTPIRTMYWWQDELHDTTEIRIALHTRLSLVDEIIDRTNREHQYEVPSVVAVPIVSANPAYHQWIIDETRDPQAST